MNTFEAKKKQLLAPLLMEAGAALFDCQAFEYATMLLLLQLSRIGVTGLDPANVVLLLDNKVKKTAGQLIAMLRKNSSVSPGIEKALEEGPHCSKLPHSQITFRQCGTIQDS